MTCSFRSNAANFGSAREKMISYRAKEEQSTMRVGYDSNIADASIHCVSKTNFTSQIKVISKVVWVLRQSDCTTPELHHACNSTFMYPRHVIFLGCGIALRPPPLARCRTTSLHPLPFAAAVVIHDSNNHDVTQLRLRNCIGQSFNTKH